jgi:hypothetical protein
MKPMRNYIQHAGFPLHIVYGTALVGEGDSQKLRVGATPYIRVSLLGKGFKSSVRTELEKLGENVEVRFLLRQYVASIRNIHEKLREHLRPDVEEWEATMFRAMERLEKTTRVKTLSH